jgi:hypothetical protein
MGQGGARRESEDRITESLSVWVNRRRRYQRCFTEADRIAPRDALAARKKAKGLIFPE